MKKNILIVRCKKELSDNTFYSISDYVKSGVAKGVIVCPDYFDVEIAEIDVESTKVKATLDGEEIAKNIRKSFEETIKSGTCAKGGIVTY